LRRTRCIHAAALGGWLLLGGYLSFNNAYLHELPGAEPTLPNPGFETSRRFLSALAAPQDAVLFQFADNQAEFLMSLPLEYYFHESPLRVSMLSMVNANDQTASFPERLRAFVDGADYLWSAEVAGFSRDANTETLEALLAEHYVRCGTVLDLPDIKLKLYAETGSGDCSARMALITNQSEYVPEES
jgi:hypothetical protein